MAIPFFGWEGPGMVFPPILATCNKQWLNFSPCYDHKTPRDPQITALPTSGTIISLGGGT